MKKVQIYSNWCEIDVLGSSYQDKLVNGEELKVQWNNGTTTIEKVLVEETSYDIMEQGAGRTPIPVSKAYIQIAYMGTPARIRLAESDLLCERVNAPAIKKSEGIIKSHAKKIAK